MPRIRPYYGWYVVVLAALVFTVITGSTYAIFGLLVIPVSAEFDLSRAEINTAVICLNLGSALIAPFIGRLLDRVPARRIMLVSGVLFGGSLMALGQSRWLPGSALIILLPLSVGLIGSGTLTMSVLIARWFTFHRGRAMTLAMVGASLGGLTIAPVAAWLIEREGWRATLTLLGLVMTVLLVALALAIRERPGPDDVEAGAAPGAVPPTVNQHGAPGHPLAVPEILKMPLFWTVGLAAALGMAVPQALGVSLVPLVLERGFSTMQGASLIAASGTSAILGKFAMAVLADRIDRSWLLAMLIAMAIVPALGLVYGKTFAAMIALAVVLGLTASVIAPIFFTLLADRFGLTNFGTVRGIMAPVTATMGAIGVRFIGEMHDATGNYDLGFQILSGAAILAALLMLASRRMACR
jgi:MFS family permease